MPVRTLRDTRPTVRQVVGAYGERVAAYYLVSQGMAILARNWRCRAGEIDIVAREGDTLVFCEVKTRRGGRFGRPAEAVVVAKARRLRELALRWLDTSTEHAAEIRFDVVGVLVRGDGPVQIEHIRGAF